MAVEKPDPFFVDEEEEAPAAPPPQPAVAVATPQTAAEPTQQKLNEDAFMADLERDLAEAEKNPPPSTLWWWIWAMLITLFVVFLVVVVVILGKRLLRAE